MFTTAYYKALVNAANCSRDLLSYKSQDGNTRSYVGSTSRMSLTWGDTASNNYYGPYIGDLQKYENYGAGVFLGSGTTPPTKDDYTWAGQLVTGYDYTVAVSNGTDDEGVYTTAVYTITNNNTQPITIGEICLFGIPGGSSDSSYKCLYERTVLESPVTIEAGGVGQVTYTLRADFPTA